MTTPTRTQPLPEILFLLHDQRTADIHVAIPGKVTRVDASKGLVDAKPLVQGWRRDASNARIPVSLPVVLNVPVMWPGGGGFRATFPIAVNDTVLLIFADRSLDRWKSLGGEVDPMSLNAHAIADAICIPGLRSFKTPLATNPTDRATIGSDSGAVIEVLQSEIDLGHGAADFLLKGNAFLSALSTLIAAISSAMTTIAVAAPAGGAPAATAITAAKATFDAAVSSYLSATVKTL